MAMEGGTLRSYQCPGINGGGNGGGARAPFWWLSAVDIVACLEKAVMPGEEEKRWEKTIAGLHSNFRRRPRWNSFDSIF